MLFFKKKKKNPSSDMIPEDIKRDIKCRFEASLKSENKYECALADWFYSSKISKKKQQEFRYILDHYSQLHCLSNHTIPKHGTLYKREMEK